MNLSCPHCTQTFELTSEVHAQLQGQPHLACPMCQGLMAMPPLHSAPPRAGPRLPSSAAAQAAAMRMQRGQHKNMLVLGVIALLALGGLAAFLASQNGGSIFNTWQDITKQIINNSYFTQLIAAGKTTKEDLEAMALIQAYEDGFIGISKDSLAWEEACSLSQRVAGDVLAPNEGGPEACASMTQWLVATLKGYLSATAWVQESGQARVLDGKELLMGTGNGRPRKVLIHWQPDKQEAQPTPAPGTPVHTFDPGPLVFENSLSKIDSLDEFMCFHGQYGGAQSLIPGVGIKTGGGHTWGMAWAKAVLGDRCSVDFEVEIAENSYVGWALKGSGTGNSADSGYAFVIRHDQLTVRMRGDKWLSVRLPAPISENRWSTIQTDINGPHVEVRINGDLVASGLADEALSGPLHNWFGLSGSEVTYRNLRIWSSEKNQTKAPQLVPPVSVAPRANEEQIYSFSEPEGPLGPRWSVHHPENVKVERGALLLTAYQTNGVPLALLDFPLTGPFAVELEYELTAAPVHNFGLLLTSAHAFPHQLSETENGWHIALPKGNGQHQASWAVKKGYGRVDEFSEKSFTTLGKLMASTSFYAPIRNHQYRARLELVEDTLRVFLDGRLLLDATHPPEVPSVSVPFYLGVGQWYTDSKIDAIRIYRLKATP